MKPYPPTARHESATTLFEVGLVVAIVLVLATLFLGPVLHKKPIRSSRIGCINNLKQINLAYLVWAGDNGDTFPMGVSVTKGGSMEMVATGNAVQTFQVMSNELSTPSILYCPADLARNRATDFISLASSNVSYFVGANVTNNSNPQAILSGDSHLEFGGRQVKPGLLSLGTNESTAWSATRHVRSGNLGMGDGSVQSTTSLNVNDYFKATGFTTNRLAIP